MIFTDFELVNLRAALLDSVLDAILLIDPEGRVVFSNRSAELMFGASQDALLGQSLLQLVPATREILRSMKVSSGADALFSEKDATAVRVTGSTFSCWFSMRRFQVQYQLHFVVVIRDLTTRNSLLEEKAEIISELHQSQEAALNIMEDLVEQRKALEGANFALSEEIAERKRIEANQARLAAIVESSLDAIVGLCEAGTITSWNAGATEIFGYDMTESIGQHFANTLIPADRRPEFEQLFAKMFAGETVRNYETVHMIKGGGQLFVALTLSPVRDERGEVKSASAIIRDITRRIVIERELALHRDHLESVVHDRTQALMRSQERLRQSERLASIGALAAGIAHEINNPVGAIMLSADNARNRLRDIGSIEEAKELFERTCSKIVSNAKRCGLIVKGVLQFARKQTTEKRPADINAIASNAVQLVRDSLDLRGTEIVCTLGTDIPHCTVNPMEIEQIFVNLVKNSVECTTENLRVEIVTKREQDQVLICVRDNGPGMSEEQRQHIFDPFFTTRQQQGGTGLGMSIVHGIVSEHDGTITVDSLPTVGTTVTIMLPIAGPDAISDSLRQ